MKKLVSLIAVALGLFLTAPAFAGEQSKVVALFKNPQCGCCEGYADYLRDNGFTVTVKSTHDLVTLSRNAGVPDEFQGCHLSFIDGYVVSGHVPVNTVNRLLSERPKIRGITLPGMPMGSPGMSGEKHAPFKIYELGGDAPKIYATE